MLCWRARWVDAGLMKFAASSQVSRGASPGLSHLGGSKTSMAQHWVLTGYPHPRPMWWVHVRWLVIARLCEHSDCIFQIFQFASQSEEAAPATTVSNNNKALKRCWKTPRWSHSSVRRTQQPSRRATRLASKTEWRTPKSPKSSAQCFAH